MTVSTTTHLNFHGAAREALSFYQTVFGGQLMIATYGDFGAPQDSPDADKVVFGQVEAENGFRVMAYDVPSLAATEALATSTRREHGMTLTNAPFFLALRGETVDEVSALWERLADGATVVEALAPAPWAPAFGMLTDRFGVTWIVDVAAAY